MPSSWIPSEEYLNSQTRHAIKFHLSQPQFDASQDYDQICRVLILSNKILDTETVLRPEILYDSTIVKLSALLHSLAPKHGQANHTQNPLSFTHIPLSFLRSISCPAEIAHPVNDIANAVSSSTEKTSPLLIQATLQAHPELAIVQDAHRLTSIGAIGIGRFFTFEGTAKGKNQNMNETMKHHLERCDVLVGMMKTQDGKRIAVVRREKIKIFSNWWDEEQELKE